MKEPQFTYTIQAHPEIRTTVQVADQAELLCLLVDMHRAGIPIQSVRYVPVPGVKLGCAARPSQEGIAEQCG